MKDDRRDLLAHHHRYDWSIEIVERTRESILVETDGYVEREKFAIETST